VPVVAAVSVPIGEKGGAGHRAGIIKTCHRCPLSLLPLLADWAQIHWPIGCEVIADGLACFSRPCRKSVAFHFHPVVRKGSFIPNGIYQNSVDLTRCLSNLKNQLSGSFHCPFRFEKYADRILGRLQLTLPDSAFKLLAANDRACGSLPICSCQPRPETTPEVLAEFAT